MIDKSLTSIFAIVADEADKNRTFGKKIEEEILKQAKSLDKKRELEAQVKEFNPNVLYKELGAEGLQSGLKNKSIAALKQIITRHNIDPSGALGSRPKRSDIIKIILLSAEKRAKRDAKLFDY